MPSLIDSIGNYIKANVPNPLKTETYSKYGRHIFYVSAVAGTAFYGWPFAVAAIGAWGARLAWSRYTAPRRSSQNTSTTAAESAAQEEHVDSDKRVLPPVAHADLEQANEQPRQAEENAPVVDERQALEAPQPNEASVNVAPPVEAGQAGKAAAANAPLPTPRDAVISCIQLSLNIVRKANKPGSVKWVLRSGDLILAHPRMNELGLNPVWFAEKQTRYVQALKNKNVRIWARLGWIRFKRLFQKKLELPK